ncbi:hemagglutinin repeat-containing protein [Ralstonia pseudosolanacearum CaRs-Mep]|nr:hemagglutinin repeat-containing protein [Ralstonia pseudosolanacearum]MCL1622078.1 hemagglutinin repeat-containing protein [Ralstonia pseudosolanacearum CaRs-Mep]
MSSSGGVVVSLNSNGVAFGVTANASGSRGKGDGSDVSWTNTHVLAGNTLTLDTIKSNFSTFDHLTPDGIAVSDKTLDTMAKTYSTRPASITNVLNGYVDDMVGFTSDGKGARVVTSEMISGKQMQLAIPYGATSEQMNAIAQSIQYAQSKGIQIVVTKIK